MLSIYTSPDPAMKLTSDGSFSAPLSMSIDASQGGQVVKRFYVRNDDASKTYNAITLEIDPGTDGVTEEANFYWKILQQTDQPLQPEWDAAPKGGPTSTPFSISDTVTYVPVWFLVAIPRYAEVRSYSSLSVAITYTEVPA